MPIKKAPAQYEYQFNFKTQAANKWGISTRRIRLLCANKEIGGVTRRGNLYIIPADTEKPMDRRLLPNKKRRGGKYSDFFIEIDKQQAKLNTLRPLL